jgi:hypothetical protein
MEIFCSTQSDNPIKFRESQKKNGPTDHQKLKLPPKIGDHIYWLIKTAKQGLLG